MHLNTCHRLLHVAFDVKEFSPTDHMKPEKLVKGLIESEGAIFLPGELLSHFSKGKSGNVNMLACDCSNVMQVLLLIKVRRKDDLY